MTMAIRKRFVGLPLPPVINVNDDPVGGPVLVGAADDMPAPATEDEPLVMAVRVGVNATLTDDDGLEGAAFRWQWHNAPTAADGDTLSGDASLAGWPISGAITPTFTPGQAQVGGFLVACVTWQDDFGTLERACRRFQETGNVNDAPTGTIAMALAADATAAAPDITQGTQYFAGVTTGGGTLADEDGISPGTAAFQGSADDPSSGFSWQVSETMTGPWNERKFGQNISTSSVDYTPDAADAGQYLRVCSFYADDQGTREGGSITSHESRTGREASATVCATPRLVANINDAPVTASPSISLPAGGSYTFLLSDFVYTDADGDALTDVFIGELSDTDNGTVQLDGTDIVNEWVPVARITAGDLVYTPPPAATAASTPYVGLSYRVRDDGSDGMDNRESGDGLQAGSITLFLRTATNSPGTGDARITGTPVEDGTLTAEVNITDANGVNFITMSFAWSQAAPDGDGNAPAVGSESAWTDITTTRPTDLSTVSSTFSPGDAQVGNFIRMCLTYEDYFTPPNMEGGSGGFCAVTSAVVTGVNDAPVSADISFDVPTHVNQSEPFLIRVSDLPYMDSDSSRPTRFSLTVPSDFTGRLVNIASGLLQASGTSLSNELVPMGDVLWEYYLIYEEGRGATSNFDSLVFSLTDDAGASTATHTLNINLVVAPQMPPTGSPQIEAFEDGDALYTEDVRMIARIYRSDRYPDAIQDPNVVATITDYIWQEADAVAGPWVTVQEEITSFTPLQAQVGKYLRFCVTVTDNHPIPETVGPICSTPGGPVVNTDDAPAPDTITISIIAGQAFTFSRDDFPFTDRDGDELTHVIIERTLSEPTNGMLTLNGNAVAVGDEIPVADIDNGLLVYTPFGGVAVPSGSHNSFEWAVRVNDADNTRSTGVPGDSTLRIFPGTQVVGSVALRVGDEGGLTLTTTVAEDQVLSTSPSTYTDGNGVNRNSLTFRWDIAEPVAGAMTNRPPGGDSADWNTVARTITFTPLQEHVGDYLRACASYEDGLGNMEGPFCGTPLLVVNSNDDATGGPLMLAAPVFFLGPSVRELPEGTDIILFARNSSVQDEDGVPPQISGWSWSLQLDSTGGGDWIERASGTTSGTGPFANSVYTPGASDVGFNIRGCMFFADATGNIEGGDTDTAETRASSASLCSPSALVTNINDAPSGTLGATDGALAEGTEVTLDPTGLMDADGVTRATFMWQWQQADPEGWRLAGCRQRRLDGHPRRCGVRVYPR